jgi:hypothetical protein
MKINLPLSKSKLIVLSLFTVFFISLSVFIGFRDYGVGEDTYNYIKIYNDIGAGFDSKFEPGFVALIKLIHIIGGRVEFVFFVVAFFISVFMYMTFLRLAEPQGAGQLLLSSLFFVSAIMFSSWYFTGVTNGLRHGMSLSVFYYSLTFLKDRRLSLFIGLFILSTLFHRTTAAILPFVIIAIVPLYSLRVSVFSVLFFSAGYYFGLNEAFVKLVSDYSGFGFYEMIKSYAEEGGGWYGFDVRFVLYNVFWFLLPIFLMEMGFIEKNETFVFLIKIFSLLTIFYFIFGFGAYANRWAYPSWLLLPILQSYMIFHMRFSLDSKVLMSFVFPISIILFANRFYGFW